VGEGPFLLTEGEDVSTAEPEILPPEAAGEPNADFLNATKHVPGEVKDDHTRDFAEMNGPRIIDAGGEPGWTATEVAAVFSGVFTLLVVANVVTPYGGEHWNIPEDKTQTLGRAWLPIFKRHVPYMPEGSDGAWIPTLLMWVGALGAIKLVCGDAIKIELKNFQLEKLKAAAAAQKRASAAGSTTGNMETGTYPASSSSPASENQVRPSSNGASSTWQPTVG
jgi:hypothetical protein